MTDEEFWGSNLHCDTLEGEDVALLCTHFQSRQERCVLDYETVRRGEYGVQISSKLLSTPSQQVSSQVKG